MTSGVNHPMSNGQAENGVKTCKGFLKKLLRRNKLPLDYNDRLLKFLVDYRNTPHSSTGVEPSVVLIGRKIRSRFDTLFPDAISDKISYKHVSDKMYNKMRKSKNVARDLSLIHI